MVTYKDIILAHYVLSKVYQHDIHCDYQSPKLVYILVYQTWHNRHMRGKQKFYWVSHKKAIYDITNRNGDRMQ